MGEKEVDDLISFVAANPQCGEAIEDTGGCRKFRFKDKSNNKGKSSGYRTVTFYSGDEYPVFLITVFPKGMKTSLTKAEKNGLSKLTKQLKAEYGRRVVSVGERA